MEKETGFSERLNTVGLKARHWDVLHNFEYRQREKFLRSLTVPLSLKIYEFLSWLCCVKGNKFSDKKIALRKIQVLAKVHSAFMKVKQ